MKFNQLFYSILTAALLINTISAEKAVPNDALKKLSASSSPGNQNQSYKKAFETLRQNGTVDFIANAKTRIAGLTNSSSFKARMEKRKHRASKGVKVLKQQQQPLLDCKIPVTLIPGDTRIIDTPGYYILDCANLVYDINPDGFVPAIQIVSSDVTLDLNGLTIRQADPTVPFGYAIQIGYGYFPQSLDEQNFIAKNVTIKNGTIKQFTGMGILALNNTYGTLFGDPATTELPFEDIHLQNINVLECGLTTRDVNEIDLLGVNGIALFANNDTASFGSIATYGFRNIIVDNVHADDSHAPAATAFAILYGENVIINNSTANNTIANEFDDPGFGFNYSVAAFYIQGKNIQMYKCQGNGTQDHHTGVFSESAQIGSFFQGSLDFYLRECQFNNTYGENNTIINVNPSNTVGWLAENCQFNNNRGGLGAGLVAGVHLSDTAPQVITANGMKWVNCQFNNHRVDPNNTRKDAFVCGYVAITATNVEFVECQACNIVAENQLHWAHGIINGTFATDPVFPFANVTSTIFKRCTISNIASNRSVFGLGGLYASGNRPRQALNSNLVVDDCSVQMLRSFSLDPFDKIAGIGQFDLIIAENLPDTLISPRNENVLIKNSRVSDVHHYKGGSVTAQPNSNSSAILLESVKRPTLVDNSLADCDRGILLTGKSGIAPNTFQLAASVENAFDVPPLPINIGISTILTITGEGIENPLPANYTIRGPRLDASLTAPVEVANPIGACSDLTNDLTGKIGVIIYQAACPIEEAIARVEAAGSVATLILNFQNQNNPIFAGSRNPTKPAFSMNAAAGQVLLNALAENPDLQITVTPHFPVFANLTRGNETIVDIVNAPRDLLYPTQDLNALGWQVGDVIQFIANGTTIPGLEDGATYFLIVYRPGFTENGLIQNNKVQNNRVAGIEDTKSPCTSSQFVANNVFCNGLTHHDNYKINWGSSKNIPVAKGSLSNYPKPKFWAENISTICGKCDCPASGIASKKKTKQRKK